MYVKRHKCILIHWNFSPNNNINGKYILQTFKIIKEKLYLIIVIRVYYISDYYNISPTFPITTHHVDNASEGETDRANR